MSFTVIKHRGHGGFGTVDEVREDASGDIYARKTFAINQPAPLSPELADNVKKRFIREAKLQKAIRHRNIVPVVFADITADPPYFLMPVADGSLADDIKTDRQLGGHYLLALLDIISGLEEIHPMAIYHRDLKPGNVLRFGDSDDKERGYFYAVGDFGLTSLSNTKSSVLTQTGMRLGSDYYTAPEIVKELKAASAQSDIFSLGCILHDFVGTDERIPCHEIKENGPYAAILLNCTRKEPNRRFKSVARVREAILSVGAVAAKPITPDGVMCAQILDRPAPLPDEKEWKLVEEYIEDHFGEPDASLVLRKITLDHIDQLKNMFATSARSISTLYARWAKDASFIFEECDGFAMRLERFIPSSPIDVQADCIMALLFMGTSHNRWYVERKFASLAGPSLNSELAKRISVEFRADDEAVCRAIAHCEISIKWSRSSLHPLLVETLNETCK